MNEKTLLMEGNVLKNVLQLLNLQITINIFFVFFLQYVSIDHNGNNYLHPFLFKLLAIG